MKNQFQHLFCIIALAIIMTISLTATIMAETATDNEMQLVCRNWLNYMTFQKGDWAGSANAQISMTQDIVVNDTIVGRYFEIEPVGYVVVPILKEMPPIKLFSDENWLDWTEPDGPTAMIKEVLINRVRDFILVYGNLDISQSEKSERLFGPEHRLEWDKYLVEETQFKSSLTTKSKDAEDLGPYLTTVWHQGSPYNNYCPWGDGGRTVVGCVATAAAQILTYYKWPLEGTGQHSYYWYGDNSCDGSTSGALLTADFTDPYDWDNIPDHCNSGCNTDQNAALAELNSEVGIAFNMDYGRCGSGAWTSDAQHIFSDFFRYHDWAEIHERSSYGMITYSDIIRVEMENERPCQYRIYSHSIVCDGWRQSGSLHQVHMNYGWGGSNNYWYTIDNLHCPWEGCSPSEEFIVTNIVPDRGVQFTSDTTWGFAPLEVAFEGLSSLEVDQWIWDFGDGDSAYEQSPTHTYTTPGRHDVKLEVSAGGDIRSYETTNYITILADTLSLDYIAGEAGDTVEVTLYATTTLPIRQLKIPIQYPGTLNLRLTDFSTEGCITNYFDNQKKTSSDHINKRATFSLYNNDGTPDLPAGGGPILKLYFAIPATATADQMAEFTFDNYLSNFLIFYSSVLNYPPVYNGSTMALAFTCGDCNGNSDVNILDITALIAYLYQGGPAPAPLIAGDVNNSGMCNILDATYMISYLYKGGPALDCP